jgi:hypothetical protein
VRYYQIDLTNPSGAPIKSTSLNGLPLSSLRPDGSTNPAALNIEFDIPIKAYHLPDAYAAHLRIWGLSLNEISQAFNLSGAKINIRAGMAQGLPLANPAQQGLIMTGTVFQSFGNWIGTDQTVEMIFLPLDNQDLPGAIQNFSWNWTKGTQMADAIRTTLKAALPNMQANINISPNLVRTSNNQGTYKSLDEFASHVNEISRDTIADPSYQGVSIISTGDQINVSDGTSTQSGAIQIAFQDLIGQPTWMPSGEVSTGPIGIQVKTVLRADISVNTIIQLPKTLAINTPTQQSIGRTNGQLTFSGQYKVLRMHHFGNFRQPDAESWCTTFDCVAISAPFSGAPSGV